MPKLNHNNSILPTSISPTNVSSCHVGHICSVLDIGRELKFPLDINLASTPTIISNPSESVAQYLRYLQRDVPFPHELLSYLVEDIQLIHRKQVNKKWQLVTCKPWDIVMVNVAVQSEWSSGRVEKLIYQSKGPFIIIENTGFSAYKVRRDGNVSSTVQKFMTYDLYMLPSVILLFEHISIPNMWYSNSNYALVNHPFHNTLDIETYNVNIFDDKPPSRPQISIHYNAIPLVSAIHVQPLLEVC